MKGVTILGSTGTIGVNALDVIARHPERFRVVALTARSRIEPLIEQCRRFRPAVVVLEDEAAAGSFRDRARETGLDVDVLSGPGGLREVVQDPETDIVVAGIVGAAGLGPTLEAARAGRRLLLANKEPLVMLGPLFMEAARAGGARVMPVDSEHNAVFQCLAPGEGERRGATPTARDPRIRRIVLTASGGPFIDLDQSLLESVTPDQACKHPNWIMGRKISVDSATMMNKGLEIIEACWLFDVPVDRVDVVIHRQSIVHSMVEYIDGSTIAQLAAPDMRIPLAHALAWPERIDAGVEPLDLAATGALEFEEPEPERFPCLGLARQAARTGGTAPALLNAANEEAVAAFLSGNLPFTGIAPLIARVMNHCAATEARDIETVLEADAQARREARALIGAARATGKSIHSRTEAMSPGALR